MADRILGMDGKRYPARPLSAAELDFVIGRAHYLRHDERLSVRQIVDRLMSENNVNRSVGSVTAYLKVPCEKCSGEPNDAT